MIKRKSINRIDRINYLVRNSPRNAHANGHIFGVGTSSYPIRIRFKRNIQTLRPIFNKKSPKFNYANSFNNIGASLYPGQKSNVKYNLMGSSLWIPQKSNVSMFAPVGSRPAAHFWGDTDKDGYYNGLDCRPYNPYQHGWYSSAKSAVSSAAKSVASVAKSVVSSVSSGVSKAASAVSSGVSKVASVVTGGAKSVPSTASTSSASKSSSSSGGSSVFGGSSSSPFSSSSSAKLPQSIAPAGSLTTTVAATPVAAPTRAPMNNLQPVSVNRYDSTPSNPVIIGPTPTTPTSPVSIGPTISPQTSHVNITGSGSVGMAVRPRSITAPVSQQRVNIDKPVANMANPAATYAVSLGYDYQIRSDAQGNQYGIAVRPDGTEINAWELFRQRSTPVQPQPVNNSGMKHIQPYPYPIRKININAKRY